MSITAKLTQTLEVTETLTDLSISNAEIKFKPTSINTLTAGTTPPATKFVKKLCALVAGALTIDLTALTGWGTNGTDEDMTGLNLQEIFIEATSTNANAITISTGASNGYPAFGEDWSIALQASQVFSAYGNNLTPEVSGTDKTIDLAGTGTQSVEIYMVFG